MRTRSPALTAASSVVQFSRTRVEEVITAQTTKNNAKKPSTMRVRCANAAAIDPQEGRSKAGDGYGALVGSHHARRVGYGHHYVNRSDIENPKPLAEAASNPA